MDRQTILQAEHDVISETYDWLNDKNTDGKGAIQYIIGVHDLALVLLNLLNEEGNK